MVDPESPLSTNSSRTNPSKGGYQGGDGSGDGVRPAGASGQFSSLAALFDEVDDLCFEVELAVASADPLMQLKSPEIAWEWQRKVQSAIQKAKESIHQARSQTRGLAVRLQGWISNPGDVEMKVLLFLNEASRFISLKDSALQNGRWVQPSLTGQVSPEMLRLHSLLREPRDVLWVIPERFENEGVAAGPSDSGHGAGNVTARLAAAQQSPSDVARLAAKIAEAEGAGGAVLSEADRRRREPLSDKERTVLEIIQSVGPDKGIIGAEIIRKLESEHQIVMEPSTLTKDVIPRLKLRGVLNRPNVGYYWLDSQ